MQAQNQFHERQAGDDEEGDIFLLVFLKEKLIPGERSQFTQFT